jgi:hypothetical protein
LTAVFDTANAIGTVVSNGFTNPYTVTRPSTTGSDRYWFVFFTLDVWDEDFNGLPTGWTQLATKVGGGNDGQCLFGAYIDYASSSSTESFDILNHNWGGFCLSIIATDVAGVNTAVSAESNAQHDPVEIQAPSITTTVDNCLDVLIGTADGSSWTYSSWTPPTGFTAIYENTSGKQENLFLSTKQLTTAGTELALTAYVDAGINDWGYGLRFALEPAGSGGGTTHDVTITESATASESYSNVAILTSSITESSTATDTQSTQTDFVSSQTELATATDIVQGENVTSADTIESATLSDGSDAVVLNLAAQLEATTASDLLTNTLITSAIINESASAIESAIAQVLHNASINEVLSASDATLSSIITQAIISENGNALESVDGVIINLAIQNESVSASDLITNILISNAVIDESSSASDSIAVELSINTELIETSSAGDSSSSQLSVTINIRKTMMTLAYEDRIYVLPNESRIYKDSDYV